MTTLEPALYDRERLCRLFRFIREHEEQCRAGGDDVRAMKFEVLVDKLLDRMCVRRG
jgi:hypothetical protein